MENTTIKQSSLLDVQSLTGSLSSRGGLRVWRHIKDMAAEHSMRLVTIAISLLAVIIGAVLFTRAWPILSSHPLADLLLSTTWQPMQGLFGFAPFIVSSLMVTLLSMLLAVPVAIFSAIYLAEYGRAIRAMFKPVIDMLASIPSVVYGLWGVLFVVPFIRNHVVHGSDRPRSPSSRRTTRPATGC